MDQYLRKKEEKLATPGKPAPAFVPTEVDAIVVAELREWIELLKSHRGQRD